MTDNRISLPIVLYYAVLAAALALVITFETEALPDGVLAAADRQTEFILTTVMELLTLCVIPVALRLFKFKRVARRLADGGETAARKWQTLRIVLLGGPLLVNTLLYYLYLTTSFGYMAIILLISMAFAYPPARPDSTETRPDNPATQPGSPDNQPENTRE